LCFMIPYSCTVTGHIEGTSRGQLLLAEGKWTQGDAN
jgi:hypothetical protein